MRGNEADPRAAGHLAEAVGRDGAFPVAVVRGRIVSKQDKECVQDVTRLEATRSFPQSPRLEA